MLATVAAFVRLSRLKFLAGGFLGGAFGTAMGTYATGRFDVRAFVVAQGTITGFHLMTHYANDYFDRACDARSRRTDYSGGSGALVDGSLPPAVALVAALVCAATGVVLVAVLGLAVHTVVAAAIGAAVGALAWAYSAPPLRLAARGLGECDTALVVAVLVPLCAFAAQLPPPTAYAAAIASTLPAGAAMFAMMLAVEFPDLASDTVGGKRNLLVRAGAARGRGYGSAATRATYAAVAAAIVAGAPPALGFMEALSLPPALDLCRAFATVDAADWRACEALAARGVAFFFLVSFDALLAYAAAPHT
ncbi:MAG: prenyltransferase [Vulcanimicrobiaceae bacterium]